jgi:hypothetical protein
MIPPKQITLLPAEDHTIDHEQGHGRHSVAEYGRKRADNRNPPANRSEPGTKGRGRIGTEGEDVEGNLWEETQQFSPTAEIQNYGG